MNENASMPRIGGEAAANRDFTDARAGSGLAEDLKDPKPQMTVC